MRVIQNCLNIAELNKLDIMACNFQNTVLTAKRRKNIYTITWPEFFSKPGSITIFVIDLYGLKSSGTAFLSKLAGVLYDMKYRSSLADPNM